MAATGEKTFDWSGSNQNPYVNAEITHVNQNAQILDGALRDSLDYGGPAKVFYNGDLDRTKTIVSRVIVKEGGTIWNDPVGAALLDASGKGYAIRLNGSTFNLYKIDNTDDYGSSIDSQSAGTVIAGDELEISITPAGLITTKIAGVTKSSVTNTTYLATVMPGACVETQNSGARGLSSFGLDGVLDDELSLDSVNINNTVTSKTAITIYGTKLDTVTGVTLDGSALTISTQTANAIVCDSVDIHSTSMYPGESVDVVITDGATPLTQSVTIISEIGYEAVVATGIDATYGLLKDTTQTAVIGDIYEGPLQIATSNITHYADGPNRNIDPAVNNNTQSTGWFFDKSADSWEQIDETTNQGSAQAPVWNSAPTPPNCVVGVPYVYNLGSLVSGDRPMTFTNIGSNLPAGIAIVDETLAGTPTESGEFVNLQLRATNAA